MGTPPRLRRILLPCTGSCRAPEGVDCAFDCTAESRPYREEVEPPSPEGMALGLAKGVGPQAQGVFMSGCIVGIRAERERAGARERELLAEVERLRAMVADPVERALSRGDLLSAGEIVARSGLSWPAVDAGILALGERVEHVGRSPERFRLRRP